MENIRIFIADSGEEYRYHFKQQVIQEPDIQVVGETGDGLECIQLIQQYKPDVVVMEMILSNLDGVGVLEKINSLKPRPYVLMVSSLASGGMLELAISKGADYYMTKPCRPSTVCERIRQLCSTSHSKIQPVSLTTLESSVTDILLEMGVPPQISGYHFLRDAILLAVGDPEAMRAVTKVLYPEIAKKYHSTAQRVERSIRHAIDSTWLRGNETMILHYFGRIYSQGGRKPTNSEFIARIADSLLLRWRTNSN